MTDSTIVARAQAQLQRCALALDAMANDVADARQIKEFSHDRCKRALSIGVAEFLESGESAAAAEHKARGSKAYGTSLHDLSEQYKAAMRCIESYEAQRVLWESARSLLSVERAKISML